MTSANRVRVASIRESTLGTTPNTPRMRTRRLTGETLAYAQEFLLSDEIRSDRMANDPAPIMVSAKGGINFEFSYPFPQSGLAEDIASAMFNDWVQSPERYNDGTADSVITDVATTGVITVTTGAAFAVGHLVQMSGFTNAGNNRIARITTASATVPSVGAGLLTAEAAPAATARVKVVGFAGVSGDITATASGLGSTTLDFTTLGLAIGMSVKIGGSAVGDRFATAACNGWARVSAIAANALTLDNLPTGWATDAGTGKTIKVWFGDYIKNGTTKISQTIEKGFLGQTTPTYILMRGMVVDQFSVDVSPKDKIKGTVSFSGMSGAQGTAANGASYDAQTTNAILTANGSVQRVTEAGATITGPDFIRSLSININNNLRMLEDITSPAPVGINEGECSVTGKATAYFGSNALLTKFYAGTPTSFLQVYARNSQAITFNLPRVTFTGGGNPNASAKNTDVTVDFDWTASISQDGTSCHILINRLEYIEL